MASGRAGHCAAHDRVSSSASHAGLDACIAVVVGVNPSRRSSAADARAAWAAGAVWGSPVHAGSAASTATTFCGCDRAHAAATAAPIDTPPTAIGAAAARAASARASR